MSFLSPFPLTVIIFDRIDFGVNEVDNDQVISLKFNKDPKE